jgi:hypothetical protein
VALIEESPKEIDAVTPASFLFGGEHHNGGMKEYAAIKNKAFLQEQKIHG